MACKRTEKQEHGVQAHRETWYFRYRKIAGAGGAVGKDGAVESREHLVKERLDQRAVHVHLAGLWWKHMVVSKSFGIVLQSLRSKRQQVQDQRCSSIKQASLLELHTFLFF